MSIFRQARQRAARLTAIQRRVESSVQISLPRRRRVPGSVWAVTLVRDEADIIEHTVRHFVAQGVAGVIIGDHGSIDGTADSARQAGGSLVHAGPVRHEGYLQGRTMSYLAHLARRAGADWVVPFDADEWWQAPEGTLAEWLPEQQENVIVCEAHNAYPLPGHTALHTAGPFSVDVNHVAHTNVAFRSEGWVWVKNGNHEVFMPGPRGTGLSCLHFANRSLDQYIRKVRQGSAAIIASGDKLPESMGSHWKRDAALSDEALAEKWQSMLAAPGREIQTP